MAAAAGSRKSRHQPAGETSVPSATDSGASFTLKYSDRPVGNGSFGYVFEARVEETGQRVAVKKVYQDPGYKNRELPIMQMLGKHPNVVGLVTAFKSRSRSKKDDEYLNLVLEFVPETVYRVVREYVKRSELPPISVAKLYTYQMLRSLAYIHAKGICHRDIKPQNLLVDPRRGILKLCDFGSAKRLAPGAPNVSYICSRYYRAPELIFGAANYTVAIDVWSAGCVFAEMLLGSPLFPGDSGVGQLVEIIKVMGTPTREQIEAMNPAYTDFTFPDIDASGWSKVFRGKPTPPPDALRLLERLLTYEPDKRVSALEALADPFFDELREPTFVLPDGSAPPPLFDFQELELSSSPGLRSTLVPAWYRERTGGAGSAAAGRG
ncbi:hypothetical protein FNF27_00405 [Cafeteria roenbergensis]|uniref:Protein kinase domain-containing protein n=2 Tax=Cafeteria roenbergensis TaxID=33653 RepID=A0A5A8D820_CAFRO|nr:hypothetical protein FNF31_06449 [Cafeteria roenbergensis]KAA0157717.1 hypothetical protein FNF29_00291 [Cafeteria roenbergensis]KAA0161662.1 hypothetical protein FNF28_04966 [Cafeteria roenbergensis]KAA0177857.1 hypothetical protein FNF27_00405 [Cafeteria roenbergensis]|eukprot:KAA0157717.1 hypothetical protein FNF29_00291 [Cafeteria roenbergensis]